MRYEVTINNTVFLCDAVYCSEIYESLGGMHCLSLQGRKSVLQTFGWLCHIRSVLVHSNGI